MRRVVAVPEIADADHHRIAGIAIRRTKQRRFAVCVQNSLESFSVRARRRTNVVPSPVEHDKARGVAEDKTAPANRRPTHRYSDRHAWQYPSASNWRRSASRPPSGERGASSPAPWWNECKTKAATFHPPPARRRNPRVVVSDWSAQPDRDRPRSESKAPELPASGIPRPDFEWQGRGIR